MATDTLNVAIPPGVSLENNSTIVFEAISPTTGLLVSGVTISNAAIYANIQAGTTPEPDTLPLLTPEALAV